jgi:hypothetical protein
MTKAIIKIFIGITLFSFVGIKYDTEFYEPEFFVKHKPNFKIEYYSPIGDSDLTLNDLNGDRKEQEIAYRDFVGNYFDRDFLDNLSFLIIPLISFLILTGITEITGIIDKKTKLKEFIFGYLSNIIWLFVTFAIYWNLNLNGLLMTIIYWTLSLFSIILINRKIKITKAQQRI